MIFVNKMFSLSDLKIIFFNGPKCKIRFICVGFNCKRKKVGQKNVWKFVPLRGGVGRLMANAILNFHFDFFCTLPLHAIEHLKHEDVSN